MVFFVDSLIVERALKHASQQFIDDQIPETSIVTLATSRSSQLGVEDRDLGARSEGGALATSATSSSTSDRARIARERFIRAIPGRNIEKLVRRFQGQPTLPADESPIGTATASNSREFHTPDSGKSGYISGEEQGRSQEERGSFDHSQSSDRSEGSNSGIKRLFNDDSYFEYDSDRVLKWLNTIEFSARRERKLRDTPIWAIMARCVC